MTGKIIISVFDSIPLWVMILPILACSIIGLAVFIERIIFYRLIRINYRVVMNRVSEEIKSNKIEEAKSICNKYYGPLIKIIYNMLESWNEAENKELLIKELSEEAIMAIEKYGGVISTIATISPMLGLLGTVTGMMKSFSGIANLGPGAQDLLAQGITEALITTALGLIVAIPSMIFHNYMVSKVDFFLREVEYIANSLLETDSSD